MKKKRIIFIILLVLSIGIISFTIAYFSNSTTVENEFKSSNFNSTVEEEFVSPNDWLPGDTTSKEVFVTNNGNSDIAVRISYSEEWKASDGTILSNVQNNQNIVNINLVNRRDWVKDGNYYYYQYKLTSGEDTSLFMDSVTFRSDIDFSSNCETNNNISNCKYSYGDYEGATYTLSINIETTQYNQYENVWNTNIAILEEKTLTGVESFVDKSNASTITDYENGNTHEMYVFNHQSPSQTDYRYIGNDPYNYVYFNCDEKQEGIEYNYANSCEIWRILGVFDVDDGTGNVEQRMKLVRGSAFATPMYWNTASNGNGYNDWTADNATLKLFLNGDYYNRTGGAATYGLKASARNMIGDAVYNLGTGEWNSELTTEQLYTNERGTTACGACNSDSTKTTWTGKVALMYPSDNYMVYGNGVNATCYDNPNECFGTDAITGWVYNSNIREGQSNPDYTWLLSPRSGTGLAFTVNSSGSLSYYLVSYTSRGVRPVVYLSSNIYIKSGTGESTNPYVLSN